MKKVEIGQKVQVYAANVKGGAYYSGAEGKVIRYHVSDDKFINGERNQDFYDIRMDGSNDLVTVHRKQLRKL